MAAAPSKHSARVKGSVFINVFVGKTPPKRLSLKIAPVPARAGCGLTKLAVFALLLRGLVKQNLSPHQFPWEEGGREGLTSPFFLAEFDSWNAQGGDFCLKKTPKNSQRWESLDSLSWFLVGFGGAELAGMGLELSLELSPPLSSPFHHLPPKFSVQKYREHLPIPPSSRWISLSPPQVSARTAPWPGECGSGNCVFRENLMQIGRPRSVTSPGFCVW